MLIPNTLFHYIMNQRGCKIYPLNIRSIGCKRGWARKSLEKREAFRKMRSEVQKRVFEEQPHLRKIRAESFKKATQKYWDTIDEEKKAEHVQKMSKSMKKAWDEGDENFGPRVAHRKNTKIYDIEKDIPRINDYSGIITESQWAELNGTT